MGQDGLVIFPDGASQYVESLTERLLARNLGPRYVTEESEEGDVRVAMHELTRAALLPMNPHASRMTGLAIGGPVVVHATEDRPLGGRYSSPEYAAQVLANCSDRDSVERLEKFVRTNLSHPMFEGVDGDRWILRGEGFDAVVISGTLRGSQEEEHDIWLFGPGRPEPFTLRIVEFTLLEAMEYMIEVDGLVAAGSPPDEFLAAVSRLGLGI
jgi:hypothetical protein